MQDDDLVLYRGPDVQASTLQRMAGLGVDTVRINLIWRNVVGKGGRKAQRKPTNPASYPAANWDPYDGAVRTAASLGMGVYVTVTGPAPDYAEGEKPPSRSEAPVWKPDPKAYGKFVQAVGRRYSGGYQDENDSAPLPAVNQWSLWNEPNQGRLARAPVREAQARLARPLPEPVLRQRPLAAAHRARRRPDLPRRDRAAGLAGQVAQGSDGPEDLPRRALPRGQALPGDRVRAPPLHEDEPAQRARQVAPAPITIANIADLENLLDKCRQHAAGAADALDRVRLRDQPARPLQRHPAGRPGGVAQPRRPDDVQRPADFREHAVPAPRRRGQRALQPELAEVLVHAISPACSTPTTRPSPRPPPTRCRWW